VVAATLDFLRALYGDDGFSGGHFYLWSKGKNKKTIWCETPELAAEKAEGLRASDVYFGVGLCSKIKASDERALNSEVSAIPGIWIDIDHLAEHHQKKDLPPTMEDAMSLLDAAPMPPSIVVNSGGGGLHAYWKFKEPLEIEDEDDRAFASRLVYGWQNIIRTAAAAKGWSVDSTHDLARVMRLPGTANTKGGACFVQSKSGAEYLPEDLEQFLPDPELEQAPKQIAGGKFPRVLPPNPDVFAPDSEEVLALCREYPSFASTWSRQPANRFSDNSSWDQSLATLYAVSCMDAGVEVNPQDIADLVHAYRNMHCQGNDKALAKGRRLDYLGRTAARAMATSAEISAKRDAEQPKPEQPKPEQPKPEQPKPEQPKPRPEEPVDQPKQAVAEPEEDRQPLDPNSPDKKRVIRDAARAEVGAVLGVPIINAIKFANADPVYYTLVVQDPGSTDIYRIDFTEKEIVKAQAFKERFYNSPLKRVPALAKEAGWSQRVYDEKVLDKLGLAWEDIYVSEDETEVGVVLGHLRSYIVDVRGISDDVGEAFNGKSPFWKVLGHEAYFYLDGFVSYMPSVAPKLADKMHLARVLRRAPLTNLPGGSDFIVRKAVRINLPGGTSKVVHVYPVPRDIIAESKLNGFRPSRTFFSMASTGEHKEESCSTNPFGTTAAQ
jgi:hypothetical protein